MAGASLLTLIDDIATLLDDVSVMTKVAAKKTAGVLGDDLALNAQQVTGRRPRITRGLGGGKRLHHQQSDFSTFGLIARGMAALVGDGVADDRWCVFVL